MAAGWHLSELSYRPERISFCNKRNLPLCERLNLDTMADLCFMNEIATAPAGPPLKLTFVIANPAFCAGCGNLSSEVETAKSGKKRPPRSDRFREAGWQLA